MSIADDVLAPSAPNRRLVIVVRADPVICGHSATAGLSERVRVLTDVDDSEKPALMAGSAAFVLPTREQPEFVETFGIALVEKVLAGGSPESCTAGNGRGSARTRSQSRVCAWRTWIARLWSCSRLMGG